MLALQLEQRQVGASGVGAFMLCWSDPGDRNECVWSRGDRGGLTGIVLVQSQDSASVLSVSYQFLSHHRCAKLVRLGARHLEGNWENSVSESSRTKLEWPPASWPNPI